MSRLLFFIFYFLHICKVYCTLRTLRVWQVQFLKLRCGKDFLNGYGGAIIYRALFQASEDGGVKLEREVNMEGRRQGGLSGPSLPASEQARGGLGGPSLGVQSPPRSGLLAARREGVDTPEEEMWRTNRKGRAEPGSDRTCKEKGAAGIKYK